MKKLIRKPIRKSSPRRIQIDRIRKSAIVGMSGENDLEWEANRLKQAYPSTCHERIDKNLEWVRRDMGVVPGSVSIQEGMLALSDGLPPLTRRSRRAPARKRVRGGK